MIVKRKSFSIGSELISKLKTGINRQRVQSVRNSAAKNIKLIRSSGNYNLNQLSNNASVINNGTRQGISGLKNSNVRSAGKDLKRLAAPIKKKNSLLNEIWEATKDSWRESQGVGI